MGRPQKTPETTGLMPWTEIADLMGISPSQARKIAARAMVKLRIALEEQGVTKTVFRSYIHELHKGRALSQEEMAAGLSIKDGMDI